MDRYREISPAEMNSGQHRVRDFTVAGRRGQFGGPFQLLIRAPEICEHAAKLGEHLRWGLAGGSAFGVGDHHDRPVLAGAIRMVRACSACRESGRPRGCRGSNPPRRDTELRATGRGAYLSDLHRALRHSPPFGRDVQQSGRRIGRTRSGRDHRDYRLLHPDREYSERLRGGGTRRSNPAICRVGSSRLRQPALQQCGKPSREGRRIG